MLDHYPLIFLIFLGLGKQSTPREQLLLGQDRYMHMSKLVPVPHNHIGFTPYHLEIPRVYTVVPLEFSRIWGGGLTRILPLIASNWPVRQQQNAAKCFIALKIA